MATDVMMATLLGTVQNSNGIHHQTYEDEILELEKILKLRDDIYAGKHPRFKPPHGSVSTFSQINHSPVAAAASTLVSEKPRAPAPNPGTRGPPPPATSRPNTETQLNDVLLEKSDVLIKAENNLKRKRIEAELKQQLEQKLLEDRLKADGRAHDAEDDDFDLDEILSKAQSIANPAPLAPDEAVQIPAKRRHSIDEESLDIMSIDQAQYDELQSQHLEKATETRRMSGTGDGRALEQRAAKKQLAGYNDAHVDRSTRQPEQMNVPRENKLPSSPKPMDYDEKPNHRASSPAVRNNRQNPGNITIEAALRERPLDQPAGVLPQNLNRKETLSSIGSHPTSIPVARVEPANQNVVIDLRDDEGDTSPQKRVSLPPRRSSAIFIKPEPGAVSSPSSVIHRRSVSPDRVSVRTEPHSFARPYYDYPPPLHHYRYQVPMTPRVHSVYDPYYRSPVPYGYPPPPVDYAGRAYGPLYPPAPYHLYDDHERVYHIPPPPQPPIPPPPPHLALLPHRDPPLRHSSHVPDRRSRSPTASMRQHREVRRRSRSISPSRRETNIAPALPSPSDRRNRGLHAPPLTPRRDYYDHAMPPPPPAHYSYPPEYYHPYPPSTRERSAYYDEREFYPHIPRPPLPVAHYIEELRPPSRQIRESSILPREADIASYRERDYPYTRFSAMPPPPPPMALLRAYPGMEHRMREIDEYRARSVRADESERGRELEYLRAISVRPERSELPSSVILPSARALSIRPDVRRRELAERPEERDYLRERPISRGPATAETEADADYFKRREATDVRGGDANGHKFRRVDRDERGEEPYSPGIYHEGRSIFERPRYRY